MDYLNSSFQDESYIFKIGLMRIHTEDTTLFKSTAILNSLFTSCHNKNGLIIELGSNGSNIKSIQPVSNCDDSIHSLISKTKSKTKLKVIVLGVSNNSNIHNLRNSCTEPFNVTFGPSLQIDDYFENKPKKKKHIKKSRNKYKRRSKQRNKNYKNDNRCDKNTHKRNYR